MVVAVLLLSVLASTAAPASAPAGAARGGSASLSPSTSYSCTITINHETKGNHAVQLAINTFGPLSGPSSPVTICLGATTFPEQLTISNTTDLALVGAGNTATFLTPTSVATNGNDLDTHSPLAAIVGAWNNTNLSVVDLAVDGATVGPTLYNTCSPGFVGIYFGNTSGQLVGDSVSAINNNGGCQTQNAVFANTGFFLTGTRVPQSLYVANSTVTNYGKNGITCNGVGLVCNVTGNTVETTPMALGYAATNGIQFDGATGAVVGNLVSGSVYLPGDCSGGTYFAVAPSCQANDVFASGILVLQASAAVNVSDNHLSANQVGIWSLSNPVDVWDNSVTGGFFAIVFDGNASDAFGPVYSTGSSDAGGNQIADANVGVFVYDGNASVTGNTIGPSNVSIEDENDAVGPFSVTVNDNSATANISGALLGDVSSFQTGAAKLVPSGTFSLTGNTFTNASALPGALQSFGALVSGASAVVTDSTFTGFSQGLAVVVQGSATVSGCSVTAPLVTTPGTGIYVFSDAASVTGNSASGYVFETGPGWWPNSQATGIFVQGAGSVQVESNTVAQDAIGIAVVSSVYGPFPAPSWPFAASPSAGPIVVSSNTVTNALAFGIAFELNQHTASEVATPTVTVSGNTVNNSVTGAVGLMVDQGTYTISGNTFEGTSDSGLSGSGQPTGQGTISTASIQVLDAYDSVTWATIDHNLYLDTSLFVALLNLTTAPEYFATVNGQPVQFAETGLTTGTVWQVTVDSATLTTTNGSVVTDLAPGSYAYSVGTVAGYAPVPGGTVSPSMSPTPLVVPIPFDRLYGVVFSEPGLPSGLSWSVTFNGVTQGLTTDGGIDQLVFAPEPNGSYAYSIAGNAGWTQGSLPYTGTLAVNGGPIDEVIEYVQTVYTVSFTEQNLPSGLSWTVTFDGVTESTTTTSSPTSLDFASEPNGTYAYTVEGNAGWQQSTIVYNGMLTVAGAAISETLLYTEVTYGVAYSESGLPSGLAWSVTFDGSTLSLTTDGLTDTLTFAAEPNGSYAYSIGGVPGWSQPTVLYSGTVVLDGAGYAATLDYTQVTYGVSIAETGLPSGIVWSVTFDGSTQSLTANGATDTLTFAREPNGSYAYAIPTVSGWREKTLPATGTLAVAGAPLSKTVHYAEVLYLVNVDEHGLPSGKSWSVAVGSTTLTTTAVKATFALPNGSYTYTLGLVPGWKPTAASGAFTVSGVGLGFGVYYHEVKYSVTFSEKGLTAGTSWSVTIGSTTISSTSGGLHFSLPNGTYSFSVSSTGHTATPSSGTVTVNGAGTLTKITFS